MRTLCFEGKARFPDHQSPAGDGQAFCPEFAELQQVLGHFAGAGC